MVPFRFTSLKFSEVAPEEVPEDSQFLLKINFSELTKSNLKTQTYWTMAMDAATKAKALESAHGARAKWMRRQQNTKIASRTKLGITAVEQQIRKDGMHRTSSQSNKAQVKDIPQMTLDGFVKRRPHSASIMESMKSNKRLRKPD